MNQKFECIEKHLYRRQYQTAGGAWSTNCYVIFTDWKKKRRTFPVGSELKTAREELRVRQARNIRREHFDAEKAEKAKGLTYSDWAKIYFKEKVDPEKRARVESIENVGRQRSSSLFWVYAVVRSTMERLASTGLNDFSSRLFGEAR